MGPTSARPCARRRGWTAPSTASRRLRVRRIGSGCRLSSVRVSVSTLSRYRSIRLSHQGLNRYGTRHLPALGITERFDRCLCIVVSEETGTLSLACQGRLDQPITSRRLHDLLSDALASSTGRSVAKDTPESRG